MSLIPKLDFAACRIAIDVAREALEQASIRVGEINTQIPRKFGDTYVPVSEFDFLVRSTDLMKSGATNNRRKETYRGVSLTSYAFGTPKLMEWLDNNPLVEFQRIDKVFNPLTIGRNPRFVTTVAARKVDLCGRIGLYIGKGNVASGPAEVMHFLNGAELSDGGRSIFALTSRDPNGMPNILLSIVGLFGEEGKGRIIAEARYIKIPSSPFAEVVFVLDEKYQQFGIASFLYKMLNRLAKEKGIKGFMAEVLFSNIGMMKVFRKGDLPVKARLESGVYHLVIPFSKNARI